MQQNVDSVKKNVDSVGISGLWFSFHNFSMELRKLTAILFICRKQWTTILTTTKPRKEKQRRK